MTSTNPTTAIAILCFIGTWTECKENVNSKSIVTTQKKAKARKKLLFLRISLQDEIVNPTVNNEQKLTDHDILQIVEMSLHNLVLYTVIPLDLLLNFIWVGFCFHWEALHNKYSSVRCLPVRNSFWFYFLRLC